MHADFRGILEGGERPYTGRLGNDRKSGRKPAFQCEPEKSFTAQR